MNTNNTPAMKVFNSIAAEEIYFDEIIYSFIEQVQTFINKNNMTQRAVAEKMGVTEAYVSKLLSGDNHNITVKTIAKLLVSINGKIHSKITDKNCSVIFAEVKQINTPQYECMNNEKEYKQSSGVEGKSYEYLAA